MSVQKNFRSWLAQADKGEEFVYHTGLLSRDRERSALVDRVADDAWSAAQQGLLVLYQRRIVIRSQVFKQVVGDGCLYLARRTGAPIPTMEPSHD
jgi:hypothetical protein